MISNVQAVPVFKDQYLSFGITASISTSKIKDQLHMIYGHMASKLKDGCLHHVLLLALPCCSLFLCWLSSPSQFFSLSVCFVHVLWDVTQKLF